MATFDIDSFKSIFDGGARVYLFWCYLDLPVGEFSDPYVYAKATSLPGSDIEESVLSFHGFDYKVHGKRTFGDWTVTLISDRQYELRIAFEKWMNSLHNYEDNFGKIGEKTRTQKLIPLDYDGSFLNSGSPNIINLKDAWPKSVGNIEMDYSNQEVAQFDVAFSYKYCEFERINESELQSLIG